MRSKIMQILPYLAQLNQDGAITANERNDLSTDLLQALRGEKPIAVFEEKIHRLSKISSNRCFAEIKSILHEEVQNDFVAG